MDICTFSDELVEYAKVQKMQDLSILPTVEGMTLIFSKSYYRQMYRKVTTEDAQQLITRFKFLGGMEVGEKRRAQLGAISYPLADGEQRIRVSTVGDFQGQESLVLRFLHPLGKFHRFFMNEQYETIADACRYRGLYLFSGPTGSGKSTLMYRLASAAAGQVITIEDPVEIVEPRFLQLQTNPMIGQDYDELIRLSLRHRPELLLIGEKGYIMLESIIGFGLLTTSVFLFLTVQTHILQQSAQLQAQVAAIRVLYEEVQCQAFEQEVVYSTQRTESYQLSFGFKRDRSYGRIVRGPLIMEINYEE